MCTALMPQTHTGSIIRLTICIGALLQKKEIDRLTVGMTGNTGEGKTRLIRILLGEFSVQPSDDEKVMCFYLAAGTELNIHRHARQLSARTYGTHRMFLMRLS